MSDTEIAALYDRVEVALESVRSYLHVDGGDVRIHSITDDYTVEVELMGECSTCSMSASTMKLGVERAIMAHVGEIKRVVTVNRPMKQHLKEKSV
jgi:Fe-S cluster biogenesis protein NfuA